MMNIINTSKSSITMPECVEGVILVITCAQYFQSRVLNNRYRLKGDKIEGWKIIYVMGNPSQSSDFFIRYHKQLDSNLLLVKCPDDYLNLFKKIAMAQEAVHQKYTIKKGILKCDDDILFNKKRLRHYLSLPKPMDYAAKRYDDVVCKNTCPQFCKAYYDISIIQYFRRNPQQLKIMRTYKPNFDPRAYSRLPKNPDGYGGAGGVYFLSKKASEILVAYFKKCDRDTFHKDKDINAYPFLLEDVGTGFILCKSHMRFHADNNLFAHIHNEHREHAMAFHTHIQGTSLISNRRGQLILEPWIIKLISD